MDPKLNYVLLEYKNKTMEILKCAEEEKFDEIEKILRERQQIIENINTINYSKEEFILISKELDLLTIEEKVKNIMNKKKDKLKTEIENFLKGKNAKSSYTRSNYVDSIFFNKKI